MNNLYKLKISLMSHGIQITPAAREVLIGDKDQPLSMGDYVTTSGLVLVLPGDIYVNANYKEEFCKRSENILDFAGGLIIRTPNLQTEVQCLPVPSYYNKKLSTGRPVTDVIVTHADRMRISPIRGCANQCQFCDMGTSFSYLKAGIDEIVEALDIALDDQHLTPRHLLISGGSPEKGDEEYLDIVYKRIIKRSPVPVDVMLAPREDDGILEKLIQWGCEGLSINLEINRDELAKQIMPEKYRMGNDTYMKFIQKAVNIFGRGKVRSSIILGLEDAESTLNGVRQLARLGCDPVLSPFKPLKNTGLENVLPPPTEFQEYVYNESEIIVREYDVLLGPRCIPCQHNTLTFPKEEKGYFFY